jgi:phosphatidylserine synthase
MINFLTGITNLTDWFGNVIMPTLAALFFVIAVLRLARHAPFQYAMYAGFAAQIVSGILRGIEKFSQQRAWNDPDAVWVTLLGLVNWSANVFLPLYGVLQIVIAVMHYGGMGFRLYPGTLWARHLVAAMACFCLSGLLRLAEFFVAHGTGGVS